jgi:hypothetical protein
VAVPLLIALIELILRVEFRASSTA